MSRILDFTFSPEEAVVSRVLILVHRAVDEHLPYAQEAGRQFTKTVFSTEDDPTGLFRISINEDGHTPPPPPIAPPPPPPIPRMQQTQSSDSAPTSSPGIPPPPPAKAKPQTNGAKSSSKPQPISKSKPKRTNTGVSEAYPVDSIVNKPDWISRITALFLLVGIAVLIYVLLV